MCSSLKACLSLFLILLPSTALCQIISIKGSEVTAPYVGLGANTNLKFGSDSKSVIPTPLVYQGQIYFCLDPLQTIFYTGNGADKTMKFPSQSPGDFNLPFNQGTGLSQFKIDALADLYTAFTPTLYQRDLKSTWALNAFAQAGNNLANYNAALQLLTWEIVNEKLSSDNYSNFSFSAGEVRIHQTPSSIQNSLTYMLGALDDLGVVDRGDSRSLHFLIDGYSGSGNDKTYVQDLVGFAPVPESSWLGTGAAGLLLYTLLRGRGSKRRPQGKRSA